MSVKETVTGVIVTVVIGGTTFAVSQSDIVNNFAADTGMSQQEAEQYVESVKDEDLVPFLELGESLIKDGQSLLADARTIDCMNYEYEWESATLSCGAGVDQMNKLANGEIALGNSFKTLDQSTATDADIAVAIRLTDVVNSYYDYEMVGKLYDQVTITEAKRTNSYNKSILQAVLDGN